MVRWGHRPRKKKGIELNNEDSGLKSQIYERTAKGKTEYVYATAGTENGADALEDALQPIGLGEQYHQASDNAKKISEKLGEKTELTFTGHSLGGGLAALNALLTDKNAITFNAAGVGAITKGEEGGLKTLMKSESKIQAIIMHTDPLNGIQNNNGSMSGRMMPDVNGVRNYVMPPDFNSVYNGHSMDNMIKVFGIDPAKVKK